MAGSLFPAWHKEYKIKYEPADKTAIFDKKQTCPMCENDFTCVTPKTSIRMEGTDKDLRPRHIGLDTLYYQTFTCPYCLFSTLADSTKGARESKYDLMKAALKPYKDTLSPIFGKKYDGDADTLFTAFFLALECAPIVYMRPELLIARTWMRICWLYADCGDADAERQAAETALNAYITVYEKTDVSREQLQNLQIIIGELYYKIADYKNAQKFFYLAKTCDPSKAALKIQAEERLDEVKKTLTASGKGE
jgi:uncharacterized protein (DUF2225 family)